MALDHDARLGEVIAELGGDRARDLFRELLQRALQEQVREHFGVPRVRFGA
jgi:hypothetical protein